MRKLGLHAPRTTRIKAGFLGLTAACVAGSLATGNAIGAGVLTAARADHTVAATMNKVGRGAVKHEKLAKARVATRAVCKPTESGRFTCSYVITITSPTTRAFCSGTAYAWGTAPTRVDPKPPKCGTAPASSTNGTSTNARSLSVASAKKAISDWASNETAEQRLGSVGYAAAVNCTRVSRTAVSCAWTADISPEDPTTTIECDEPPAIAFTSRSGSSEVTVTGRFEIADCYTGGGSFNAG